jgi:hypothetical protein
MKVVLEIETLEWPDNTANREAVIRVIKENLKPHLVVRDITDSPKEEKQCQSTNVQYVRPQPVSVFCSSGQK